MAAEREPYRGALIGCGYISESHLKAWSQIPEARIVAVADLDRDKATRRAKAFEIPAVYSDYRAMLAQESLDFVDIATPPDVHLEMVTEAAGQQLQVLCQKPVAPTLADLEAMIRVCEQAGVTFMVNENARFQPWFRRAGALLQANAIGRPYYINLTSRARGSMPVVQFGNQPFFATMPRLIVYELGVHFLDTLRYLFGEATHVYAQTRRVSPNIAGEDSATLLLGMAGLTAVVDMSWASLPTWDSEEAASWAEVRIEGELGTLHLRTDGLLRLITDDGEKYDVFSPDAIQTSFLAAQQHFIDCLRTGAEPETSGHETLKTMELVFGAYDSAAHNRIYFTGQDRARLK